MQCCFFNCNRNAVGGKYCLQHERIVNGKKNPGMKKVSDKRAKENRTTYAQVKKIKFFNSNICELQSPVCTWIAEGLDHTQKTSPNNRTDVNNLKRSCNACNLYKETHPEWAQENGHHVSRFKK